jgi:bifunctional non-homologous end joining protein LigD
MGEGPGDDPLVRYRALRDFDATPEPAGGASGTGPGGSAGAGGRFVVQRHRARRLHYDLRLEMGGVLVSWAVPKGPSLDPTVKRLAVHVEDHPLDYADFEGVIPKGAYGAGDVIVWDRGTWSPAGEGDPVVAVAEGELHVDLHGEKLAGRFALVRRSRPGDGEAEQWLLVHKHDEAAVEGWDPEDHPRSVLTGRTNAEVAAGAPGTASTGTPTPGSTGAPGPAGAGAGDADPAPAPVPDWAPVTDEELDALDHLGAAGTWEVAGREVKLTNLDKVLFPGRDGGEPVTKRDLVRYHARVGPHLLAYLFDRPVNLQRFPNGVEAEGFWQKAVPKGTPGWVTRWHRADADREAGDAEWYVVVDSIPTLVWLANQGAVELHPWTSSAARPDRPTWAYVDIDPGPAVTFDDVIVLARLYRTALDHLGVAGCPKVTGKRGIQIWIPVSGEVGYDETRDWVEAVSRTVGATVPDLVSWAWRTADRKGLARLDYTQNASNKTLVAPFSARPVPGAPVSVPVTWDEIDDPELTPDRWDLRTACDRLAEVGDPLRPLVGRRQRLPAL